jgi:nucleotide-binding universal stress UspA family protein
VADVILTVLDNPAAAQALLGAARCLAGLCDAHRINALLIRVPPEALVLPSEEMLTARREADLRQAEAARAQAVRAVFDAWAPDLPPGLTVDWVDTDGIPELVVEERGRRADWIAIERPTPHDYGASWQALRAAMFATDRPVLIVPRHRATGFGRRVAIAWHDDERATKAVLAAVRCLAGCERVYVLAGTREGAAEPQVPEILNEHGIAAELHVLKMTEAPFGATLLHKAHELGADMLVMGAYQHSPLRELFLGGVTRHVLSHADLPVLLRH